jgi:hypothetical protein
MKKKQIFYAFFIFVYPFYILIFKKNKKNITQQICI